MCHTENDEHKKHGGKEHDVPGVSLKSKGRIVSSGATRATFELVGQGELQDEHEERTSTEGHHT